MFQIYPTNVFQASGTTFLDPYTSTIILGVMQILGTVGTSTYADILGRKNLMIISLAGSSIGLSVFGAYLYLHDQGHDLEIVNWIPVVSMSFVILIASFGIIPLSALCTLEMFPAKVRRVGVMYGTFAITFISFFMAKFFPICSISIGMHGCMFIYAVCSFFGVFFVIFAMKESNGISLDSIVEAPKRRDSIALT